MAISKTKKQSIVETVVKALKGATSIVFVHFSGLSVSETTSVRKTLRDEGIGYYVAKKSLIRLALDNYSFTGDLPDLPGEIAIAWSDGETTATARAIYEQGKKKKDTLTIVGGMFESAYVNAMKMQEIATIPPVPVLRGMFVNVINAPLQGFVIALDQIREMKAGA